MICFPPSKAHVTDVTDANQPNFPTLTLLQKTQAGSTG